MARSGATKRVARLGMRRLAVANVTALTLARSGLQTVAREMWAAVNSASSRFASYNVKPAMALHAPLGATREG
jgi:hypothetical protein